MIEGYWRLTDGMRVKRVFVDGPSVLSVVFFKKGLRAIPVINGFSVEICGPYKFEICGQY